MIVAVFDNQKDMAQYLDNYFQKTSQDKYELLENGDILNIDASEVVGNIYSDKLIELFDCRIYKVSE